MRLLQKSIEIATELYKLHYNVQERLSLNEKRLEMLLVNLAE